MRRLAFWLAVLAALSACATNGPQRDSTGHTMPHQCKFDLAAVTAGVPVFYTPRDQLEKNWRALGGQLSYGYTVNGMTQSVAGMNFIHIADDMTGWRRAETEEHERFHAACNITRDACCTGHFAVAQ